MTDFALDRPADALVCLFSSIGYVAPGDPLTRAAACFFRALRPGGVALVEPWWFPPGDLTPTHLAVQTYDGAAAKPPEPMKLVRAAAHVVDAGRSVFDFHWLVVTPSGTEHFVDHHELFLADEVQFLGAFRAAGFDARWLHPGPVSGRPLVIARRPA